MAKIDGLKVLSVGKHFLLLERIWCSNPTRKHYSFIVLSFFSWYLNCINCFEFLFYFNSLKILCFILKPLKISKQVFLPLSINDLYFGSNQLSNQHSVTTETFRSYLNVVGNTKKKYLLIILSIHTFLSCCISSQADLGSS